MCDKIYLLEAAVTSKESLHRDYGLLTRFLRSISLRFQLRTTLEFLFLLPSGFILVLLGGLFVIELKGTVRISALFLLPWGNRFPILPLVIGGVAVFLQAIHGAGGQRIGGEVSSIEG